MSELISDRRFPTTHWSIISRLRSSDAGEAQEAVREVFTTYRYPLYGFLRSSSIAHEDAEDVLQSFFEKMLRNDSLGDADRQRGKLRTFLLTALSRFKLNWQRGEQRRHQRVRGEAQMHEADEARYQREQHATQETPETYFDRRWAMELIERVRRNLGLEYARRGKQDLHAALMPFLSSSLPETESFAAIAARLDLSDNALRISLHRLRGDFRELLLQEVQSTLDEGEDVKAEIRHLLSLFER